jgi:hypothetical protein
MKVPVQIQTSGVQTFRWAVWTLLIPVALFFGVKQGLAEIAPSIVGHYVGSKAEAQKLVRDVVTDQVSRAVNSGDPAEQERFRKAIDNAALEEVRSATRDRVARMQLTDEEALRAEITRTILAEVAAGVRAKVADVDVNSLLAGAADPAIARELLEPLAQQLPGIVASKLDVNALLGKLTGDPGVTSVFAAALGQGLAVEIGKDFDFNPLVQQLLRSFGLLP